MSGDLPIKIEVDNTLPKDTVILRNDRQEVKIINIGNVMTDERLAEIENRVNKAVDGQWEVKHGTYAVHSPLYECWIPQDIDDAEFIAHARQDIPDLISALRSERKAGEQWHAINKQQCDINEELRRKLEAERAKVIELEKRINPIIEHVIKMNKDSHIRMKEELTEGKVAYEFGIQDFTSSILGDLMRSGFIYRNNDGELITKGV